MFGLLSWGIADYLATSSAGRIGSLSTALLVQFFGIALPLPFVVAELASGSLDVDWSSLAIWAPVSAGFLGLAYLAYYTGLQRGQVSVVTSAASAWLAVTVIIAVALFGESVTLGQAGLMFLILAGVLMLSLRRESASGDGSGLFWGLGAMLGLGVALAVLARVTEAAGPMLAFLVVRSLSVVTSFLFVRSRGEKVRLPRGSGSWRVLIGAAFLDAGGYVGYNLGVEASSVAVAAPLVAAHPVATIALAVVIMRERPRAMQWAGAVVSVSAVVGLSALVGV